MNVAALLMLACCLPVPVTAVINRAVAERKRFPERWQSTPIPPIRMPVVGEMSVEELKARQKEWQAHEKEWEESRKEFEAKNNELYQIEGLLRALDKAQQPDEREQIRKQIKKHLQDYQNRWGTAK